MHCILTQSAQRDLNHEIHEMLRQLNTLYQLAYEAAMRGRTECRRQSSEGEQEEGSEGMTRRVEVKVKVKG